MQPFWDALARGEFITQAAESVGTYRVKGKRLMAATGGIRPRRGRNLKGRCLTFAEREEIALRRAAGESIRCIARSLGRSPSTASRELRRNADRRGGYQGHCRARAGVGARQSPQAGQAAPQPPAARDRRDTPCASLLFLRCRSVRASVDQIMSPNCMPVRTAFWISPASWFRRSTPKSMPRAATTVRRGRRPFCWISRTIASETSSLRGGFGPS
jgi:Helix-turn-helix domain